MKSNLKGIIALLLSAILVIAFILFGATQANASTGSIDPLTGLELSEPIKIGLGEGSGILDPKANLVAANDLLNGWYYDKDLNEITRRRQFHIFGNIFLIFSVICIVMALKED